MTEGTLVQALVEELAAVAASMVGAEPRIDTESGCGEPLWILPFTITGSLEGRMLLALPVDNAARLTAQMLGFDDAPPEDVVADSLKEMAQQVASAATVKHGPDVKVAHTESIVTGPAAPAGARCASIALGDLQVRVAAWGSVAAVEPKAARPAPVVSPAAALPLRNQPANPTPTPGNLDLILDIDLPLWVRFGETAMTMAALAKIGPGTTIDLERSPEDAVDVMVNNTVIARGEVVVVAGNYGVRVTEVVSTTDRIRSMAG